MIEEDDEIKKLQKLTAGYESEDSFDEEERTKKVKISNKSKKISINLLRKALNSVRKNAGIL